MSAALPWLCEGCGEPCLGRPHAQLDPTTARRPRRVCSAPCLEVTA